MEKCSCHVAMNEIIHSHTHHPHNIILEEFPVSLFAIQLYEQQILLSEEGNGGIDSTITRFKCGLEYLIRLFCAELAYSSTTTNFLGTINLLLYSFHSICTSSLPHFCEHQDGSSNFFSNRENVPLLSSLSSELGFIQNELVDQCRLFTAAAATATITHSGTHFLYILEVLVDSASLLVHRLVKDGEERGALRNEVGFREFQGGFG